MMGHTETGLDLVSETCKVVFEYKTILLIVRGVLRTSFVSQNVYFKIKILHHPHVCKST